MKTEYIVYAGLGVIAIAGLGLVAYRIVKSRTIMPPLLSSSTSMPSGTFSASNVTTPETPRQTTTVTKIQTPTAPLYPTPVISNKKILQMAGARVLN